MKVEKKVIGNLTKCYSIAPLHYEGKNHILVAAEKQDACLLYDLEGNLEDTVWTEPGGVMTMVQVPGTDGQFLATHKFFSPNDSKEAKIVIAAPKAKGDWKIRTLVDLPFVHRFDVLERNGVRYLIACALKSGHEYKDDWSMPGKVYAAVLPDNLDGFDADHQLELKVIKEDMLKNHGYYRAVENGVTNALISAEQGVFQFVPPAAADAEWEIRQLIDQPTSDAVLVDLDGDGERELIAISKFHGDTIVIYKKDGDEYKSVYAYDQAEFAHAIYGGEFCGKNAVVIGHRKGTRDLLVFTWNGGGYGVQKLDEDCGPANVYRYVYEGRDVLISTNREIDEVAMYICEK